MSCSRDGAKQSYYVFWSLDLLIVNLGLKFILTITCHLFFVCLVHGCTMGEEPAIDRICLESNPHHLQLGRGCELEGGLDWMYVKGALEYNIYLFTSNSIENFKLNQYQNIQLILQICVFILWSISWTASSSERPIGYCVVYLLKLTLKNRKW